MLTRFLRWLVRPWVPSGGGLLGRAVRIYGVVLGLAVFILPAMLWQFGVDGWLWHITLSVLLCAPLGVVLMDALADRLDRSGRLFRRLGRLPFLFLGLALGVGFGYLVPLLFPVASTPDLAVLARDYRRNMVIFGAVALVLGFVGTFLWYRAEAFRLQREVAVAGLQALKRQMEPHFLFNALNSLKELIAEDSTTATVAVQQLADLYRLVLQAAEQPTHALAAELAIVERYLAIEQIRFGERLRFQLEVPPELGEVQVPSLVIQTLVENGVKHGICKDRRGGALRLSVSREAGGLIKIVVANTGAPYVEAEAARARGATGLSNTRARLDLLYGAAHQLRIESGDDGETRVSFRVTEARP